MIDTIISAFSLKFFCAIALFILLYVILKKNTFSYWQKHGVPHESFSLPAGIVGLDFFRLKINIGDVIKKSYDKCKKYPFYGVYIFYNKYLMVNDVELIKSIMTKDFSHFIDRGFYSNHKADPLSGNLIFLKGSKWRLLRAKVSPKLTSGKLKHMFPIIREVTAEMIRATDEVLAKTNILEMKDIVSRYTTDSIFNLCFGVKSGSLRDPQNEYRYFGDLFFTEKIVPLSVAFMAPQILEFFNIPVIDDRITKFFTGLFDRMVIKRRNESTRRNDVLDALIDLLDNEQIIEKDAMSGEKLEPKDALPQAFVIFMAGFETSASLISHWLYELALNPEVQAKLHKEIDELLEGGDSFIYENLMQLEYLDMAYQEALRKHPPVSILNRICGKDYKIPNSNFTIPKGMRIICSVSGIQNNPDFYPEPEKFDPTRFSKENVARRPHLTYIPFGEGPRNCIGQRVGTITSKVAIFSMLSNYKFSVCEKTPIPNYYSPMSLVLTPRDGIYLKVERRREIVI